MADVPRQADVAVIGGGVAGLSLAGELAPHAQVVVLERETHVAYHSSGRSAAVYIEPYSSDAIFALTRATLPFLLDPPDGFTQVPLSSPRGSLTLVPESQLDTLDGWWQKWAQRCPEIREISVQEAKERLPVLREGYARKARFDPTAIAMDTHEMLQGWAARVRAHGGQIACDAEIRSVRRQRRQDAGFEVHTSQGVVSAGVVVNAAGAWASEVAHMAGASAIELQPRRRTAALVDAPAGHAIDDWPVVADAIQSFYFKPEGKGLMVSPADATPCEPCDAAPEELDLATGVANAEVAADLGVRRLQASWAGLRTFAADENPVLGWDPHLQGFYWCAGQGGTGFQTSYGYASLAAHEIAGRTIEIPGLVRAEIAPDRLVS